MLPFINGGVKDVGYLLKAGVADITVDDAVERGELGKVPDGYPGVVDAFINGGGMGVR